MAAANYGDIEKKALDLAQFFHVETLLQELGNHKPDPWLRLVIKHAVEIVCNNKIFEDWKLKIEKTYDGQALITPIREDAVKSGKTPADYASGNFFPLHNIYLNILDPNNGDDIQYEIKGGQFPDTVVIIKAAHTDGREERIVMVFEGEAHAKDHGKKGRGMFLYQKMFQDAAFCQDIHMNHETPAIFIALAMRTCEADQTVPQWTRALLESCVLLITRLLMYTLKILPRATNFIEGRLRSILPYNRNTTYDLYCFVNAKYKDQGGLLEFDAHTCFDEFSSREILNGDEVDADAMDATGTKDHNCEFINILKYNHLLAETHGHADDWPLIHPNSEHTFYAKKIQFTRAKMPITILAVERATAVTVGGQAQTTKQKNIDRTEDRLQLLADKIVTIDLAIAAAAAAVVPVPAAAAAAAAQAVAAAAILKDQRDRKTLIALEVRRLQRDLAILQATLAAAVIKSRGMWYPRNVKNLVGAYHKNRSMASLVPLNHLIAPITWPTRVFDFDNLGQKELFIDTTNVPTNIDDFDGHICVTLPWLWINIGFLYLLNRKVQYDWLDTRNLDKKMDQYKAKNPSGRWRGGIDNLVEVQMFPVASKTLFARLCRQNVQDTETVKIDPAFETFLLETCGWQDCNLAQSPAMFFRLLGVSNVKTGCLISSNMLKTPNPRFENIKKSFPLNAQVEIEYAVQALAATVYHTAP